jgi:hypothetical protein
MERQRGPAESAVNKQTKQGCFLLLLLKLVKMLKVLLLVQLVAFAVQEGAALTPPFTADANEVK